MVAERKGAGLCRLIGVELERFAIRPKDEMPAGERLHVASQRDEDGAVRRLAGGQPRLSQRNRRRGGRCFKPGVDPYRHRVLPSLLVAVGGTHMWDRVQRILVGGDKFHNIGVRRLVEQDIHNLTGRNRID